MHRSHHEYDNHHEFDDNNDSDHEFDGNAHDDYGIDGVSIGDSPMVRFIMVMVRLMVTL